MGGGKGGSDFNPKGKSKAKAGAKGDKGDKSDKKHKKDKKDKKKSNKTDKSDKEQGNRPKPCHFFLTKRGCDKGDDCTFYHDRKTKKKYEKDGYPKQT